LIYWILLLMVLLFTIRVVSNIIAEGKKRNRDSAKAERNKRTKK